MGKRSSFERVEKDFYRTIDTRAVDILQPFLVSIDGVGRYDDWGNFDDVNVQYAEPCCGHGDLIRQLNSHGHECVFASDIDVSPVEGAYWVDALKLVKSDFDDVDADVIITNPPWSRDILHPLITHFSNMKPTWLLFDSGWSYTKQSSHFMKELCTDIVAVGRLKWIEGTTMQGKDDCAWYRFDINKKESTKFHGRTT